MATQQGSNRSPHVDDILKKEDAETSAADLPRDEENLRNGRTGQSDAPPEDVGASEDGRERG